MKNLFVLPTDKPSRLFVYDGKLGLAKEFQYGSDAIQNQKIYITNEEKTKYGDWCIDLDSYFVFEFATYYEHKRVKKIILTTDPKLIKDGVQAIEDEFLEWFVKNPNFEEIGVEQLPLFKNPVYKTVIPKEEINQDNKWSESTGDITSDYFIAQSKAIQKCMLLDAEMAYNSLPKQDSVYKCTCLRPQVNCFSGMCSYCNRQIVKNLTTEDLKPKIVGEYQQELFNYLHDLGVTALQSEMQEVERIVLGMQQENSNINALHFEIDALKREIKALKHQKEQDKNKYSEEDIVRALHSVELKDNKDYSKIFNGMKEWFEQFKNK